MNHVMPFDTKIIIQIVGGEKNADITSISAIYIWILKSYPIENGFIVKSMLAFAMNNTTSLNEKMIMATDIVETCLDMNVCNMRHIIYSRSY